MKFKHILLAAGFMSLVGCAATGNDDGAESFGNEVDTPDPLLEETSKKQASYGDADYGLAADAKEHDQQIKPDPLEQGLARKNTKQVVAKAAKPKVKASVKSKKKAMTDDERRAKDSALEVSDPLLGEVEPA